MFLYLLLKYGYDDTFITYIHDYIQANESVFFRFIVTIRI